MTFPIIIKNTAALETMKKNQNYAKNINTIHQQLYKNLKNKALSLEFGHSSELKEYTQYQKKLERRPFEVVSPLKLVNKIQKTQIIYLGDFHTFDQSSRNFERILRELIALSKTPPMIALGLEMIHVEDQAYIDAYLQGHLTEMEFLESISFHHKWQFPWNQYSALFEYAKKNNFPVLALNSSGSIHKRDNRAAKVISTFLTGNPSYQLFVFFGELHILPNNLPEKVFRLLNSNKYVIVHQNLDMVYWKLAKKKKISFFQKDQVVKFNDQEFALLSAVPWIKYESMIYWHELDTFDSGFMLHQGQLDKMTRSLGDNAYDNFLSFSKSIIKILNLPITGEDVLEDFELLDQLKIEQLLEKLKSLKSAPVIKFYTDLVTRGYIFRVPKLQLYYCPNYSINRLNMLIGLHLRYAVLCSKYSGFKNNHIDLSNLIKGTRLQIFSQFLLDEACSFYVSKLINPFRKCDHRPEILKKSKKSSIHAVALKLLKNKRGKNLINLLKGKDRTTLLRIARVLGPLCGHIISLQSPKFEDQSVIDLKYKVFSRPYLEMEELQEILELLFRSDHVHANKRIF